jgi:alpha-glucosidase (family GH31 glycosyl hydrolase)
LGRDKDGTPIIDTTNRKLLLSDKFSEMGIIVPTTRLWGLGQRNGRLFLDSGSYTLFARGREESLPEEDYLGGKSGNHIHPFILGQSKDKTFFGIFYANAGAQHFEIVHFTKYDVAVINYIHLGPNIEVYFMFGPTAQNVVQQYHSVVGRSALLPYYALGVFQGASATALKSEADINSMFKSFADKTFVLEGLIDEEYQKGPYWEFTLDAVKYPTIGTSLTAIRAKNQRMIWGASVAISSDAQYEYFQAAQTFQCTVTSGNIGQPQALKELRSMIDSTSVVYIDPFSTGASSFYSSVIPSFA